MYKNLLLALIPLFIALTPSAILGVYLSFTDGMDKGGKKRVLYQAIATAFAVSILFALLGKAVFRLLGITTSDFQVAGGIILVVLSIIDLAAGPEEAARAKDMTVGVVPLGVPVIVGPAVLTTIVILLDLYGFVVVLIALVIDLLLIMAILSGAEFLQKMLKRGGIRAFTKIMRILLAAIGIMMIRKGIIAIMSSVE
jgi:multiple antibiotic resistance protein